MQEEKNQQLPTSAQSELTATLSLLRIIILKTSYTALSIWPIDRPSRKDFLVAIVLKQLNNCRTHVGFSADIKSALEHHHLSHALWEHYKHQTRSLGTIGNIWMHCHIACVIYILRRNTTLLLGNRRLSALFWRPDQPGRCHLMPFLVGKQLASNYAIMQ